MVIINLFFVVSFVHVGLFAAMQVAVSLMMIWFNLISTLRGKFDSLQGPSDASEEARYRFLLKWRGSPMLQMVDGNAKWIYPPPRWLFSPRVPNIELGAES